MDSITLTELRTCTNATIERVQRSPTKPLWVKHRGKRAIVVLDAGYFDDLLATMEILADTDAVRQIRQGLDDAAAGRLIPHDRVAEELGLRKRTHRRRQVS